MTSFTETPFVERDAEPWDVFSDRKHPPWSVFDRSWSVFRTVGRVFYKKHASPIGAACRILFSRTEPWSVIFSRGFGPLFWLRQDHFVERAAEPWSVFFRPFRAKTAAERPFVERVGPFVERAAEPWSVFDRSWSVFDASWSVPPIRGPLDSPFY